jgi:hypothetical protein
MSSIEIQDLSRSIALDQATMSSVRGGAGFMPDVNVNVALNQQFVQVQQVGVNVLNNNAVIGASFGGADMGYAAAEWKYGHAM